MASKRIVVATTIFNTSLSAASDWTGDFNEIKKKKKNYNFFAHSFLATFSLLPWPLLFDLNEK